MDHLGARRCGVLTLVVLAVTGMLALPGVASAFSWDAPQRVSDPSSENLWPVDGVFSAMNAAGVMQVAWDANEEDLSEANQVRTSNRAATGAWGAPETIAGAIPNTPSSYTIADLEVEPDGDSIAILVGPNPAGGVPFASGLYSSFKPHGGSWSEPKPATSNEQGTFDIGYGAPQLIVDGNGNASLFYGWWPPSGATGVTIRRADWNSNSPASDWTNTVVHTTPNNLGAFIKSADMNDSGAAVAIVTDYGGDYGRVFALTKGSTGGWSSPTKVGTDNYGNVPRAEAGIDPNGNAHVVIMGCVYTDDFTGTKYCMSEATKPAAGSWSANTEVPHVDDWVGFDRSSLDQLTRTHFEPDGRMLLFLDRVNAGVNEKATMAYSNGSWSAPELVPTGPDHTNGAANARAVIDSNGTEHAVFTTSDPDSNIDTLWATRREPGGSFSAPQAIDAQDEWTHLFEVQSLQVDADGEPAVVYQKAGSLFSSRGGAFPKAEVTPTPPGPVDFGSSLVGTAAPGKQVKIKNTGDAPLHISEVTLTGSFTATNTGGTSACVTTLAVGAECVIDLGFTPTDTTPRSGSLVFVHDAAGTPSSVTLTGTGHNAPGGGDPGGGDPGGGDPGGGNPGGGAPGGDPKPSPQQAGQTDALKAMSNLLGSTPLNGLVNGLSHAVNSTLEQTTFDDRILGLVVSGAPGLNGTSFLGPALGPTGLRKSQVVGTVKCPASVLKKKKKAKCKNVVLASGSLFLPLPGAGTVPVKPTSVGAGIFKKAIAYAKAQKKKKGKKKGKVSPMKVNFSTSVRAGGASNPAVTQSKPFVLKP